MADIRALQDQIIRDFQRLEDPFDQYTYLLALSARLPVMSEERRAALTPVAGCQSHVWLDVRREGELLVFDADSDTMLIRGILCLLQQVLSHQPPAEVAEAELDFPEKSGLLLSLSPSSFVERTKFPGGSLGTNMRRERPFHLVQFDVVLG